MSSSQSILWSACWRRNCARRSAFNFRSCRESRDKDTRFLLDVFADARGLCGGLRAAAIHVMHENPTRVRVDQRLPPARRRPASGLPLAPPATVTTRACGLLLSTTRTRAYRLAGLPRRGGRTVGGGAFSVSFLSPHVKALPAAHLRNFFHVAFTLFRLSIAIPGFPPTHSHAGINHLAREPIHAGHLHGFLENVVAVLPVKTHTMP